MAAGLGIASGVAQKGRASAIPSSTLGLKETHTDELVFALCGPIGSSLQAVTSTLEKLLRDQFDYEVKVVRLSEIIEQLDGSPVPKGAFARVSHLIERGNLLRQRFGPSILADVAIREIAVRREERKLPGDPAGVYRPARVCHIVDSIKNEAELEALRLVYRDMLHCIGVFSPMPHREQHLKAKGMDLSEIYKLIDQDSGEEFSHGQTVRKTFPKADYFLRAPLNGSNAVEARMLRYLNLVFSTAVITPTTAETAMYQAASASRNSACLSRQVGASIVDQNGLLLAIGWNDVPRFQGGLYVTRAEDVPPGLEDHRCANWGGKCYNDAEKSLIAAEATEALAKAGLLVGDRDAAIKTILESKVGRLIEFSRAIHAEMHAILSASHSAGARLKGASLYCTTYPCHYCARHIVAAGIISVYYIQPYGKSLAGKLHHDSISEAEGTQNRVTILPYDGVAPSKYLELFAMPTDERKDKGGVLKSRNPRDARPKSEVTLESLPALEGLVVTRLKNQNLLSSDEGGAA